MGKHGFIQQTGRVTWYYLKLTKQLQRFIALYNQYFVIHSVTKSNLTSKVKNVLQALLIKIYSGIVSVGKMYILSILFIAIVLAAILTFISYMPLLFIGRNPKISKPGLFHKTLLVN